MFVRRERGYDPEVQNYGHLFTHEVFISLLASDVLILSEI
jgi:hypothetical protein